MIQLPKHCVCYFFCCYSFAENKQWGKCNFFFKYEQGNKLVSVKMGSVADWTPLRSLFLFLYSIFKVRLWSLNEKRSNKMRQALLKPSVPKPFWSTHVKHLMTLNLRRAPVVIFSVSARVSLGRRMGEWELRPRAIALPVAKH